MIEYHGLTVCFVGDSAFDEAVFREVAVDFPAIDLAIIPIGSIEPVEEMLPRHLDPNQAMHAWQLLGATHVLPVRFGNLINSLDPAGAVEKKVAERWSPRFPKRKLPLLKIGERHV